MKKIVTVLMVITLSILLTGCSSKELVNEENGFKAYVEKVYECPPSVETLGTQGGYSYSFPCVESTQYSIEDENSKTYSISQVLIDNVLTLEELYILLDGKLEKKESTLDVQTLFEYSFNNITLYGYAYIDSVNSYDIYTSINSNQVCDMEVSFTVDNHDFTANSGCNNDFVTIGYFAIKDNVIYKIEDLLDDNKLTVQDILTVEGSYIDYNNPRLNKIISQDDILTQNEDTYYVYFYSLTCSHCNSMKTDLITHILGSEDIFYLASVQDLQATGGWPSDISGVPTMVKVVNGEITDRFVGTSEIGSLIEK